MIKSAKQQKIAFLAAVLCVVFAGCLSAQAVRSMDHANALPLSATRKHPGAITSCVQGADASGAPVFFFGDSAGFISMHEVYPLAESGERRTNAAASSVFFPEMKGMWQVSDLPIRMIAAHPDGKLIAIYESDGFSTHRVSLWNWAEKQRIYAKRFQDSINAISWSANGTYLMVANTSFNGITFLKGEAGTVTRPFNSSPGIVNLSATGKSERSVVNYAPAGRIVYTNLSSGETIEEYLTEPNLFSTSLCNNNRTIIGFTESGAFAVNALDGSVLSAFDAKNPVAATASADTEPVWFERAAGEWFLRRGDLEAEFVDLPAGTEISAAAGTEQFRIFGTNTGDIYVFAGGTAMREDTVPLTQIMGICASGDFFYFIADGNLYRAAEYGEEPALLLSSSESAGRAAFGAISSRIDSAAPAGRDTLLLWSSTSPAPLVRFDEKTGETARLYTPERGITSLSVTESGIALIEGNSRAVFIGNGSGAPFVYSATGLQDAVMVSDTRMLVAKSSDTRSPAPLILIDVSTGETVPLSFSADICFSLTPVSERQNILYAYAVTSGSDQSGKRTEVILIRLNTERVSQTEIETVAVYSDEDLSAELFPLAADRALATLGKTGLSEIRRRNGRQRMFERTYSLPAKIAATEKSTITLNCDGSLSWYSTSGKADGNLALSLSGEWMYDR